MGQLKTINEWSEYFGVIIKDPDGFDRTDIRLYERRFTKAEFQARLSYCTVSLSNKNRG